MKDFFNLSDDIEIAIPKNWVEFQGKLILDLVDELDIHFKDVKIENNELKCVADKKYKHQLEYLQWRANKQRETIMKLEEKIERSI